MKKTPPPEPVVRAWEIEVRLTGAQLDALNRGASIRVSVRDPKKTVISSVVIGTKQ